MIVELNENDKDYINLALIEAVLFRMSDEENILINRSDWNELTSEEHQKIKQDNKIIERYEELMKKFE